MTNHIPGNPFIALHEYKKRAEQIQNKLATSAPYQKSGVLDFNHFHLKKEEKDIKNKMTEIRRTTHPDIIA